MIKNRQFKNKPKATICRKQNCITVEGDTAKFVNVVVAFIATATLITVAKKLISNH